MAIKKETLDHLLDGRNPKEVFNKDGLFDELKKALAERVLNAEIDDHLDGETAEGRKNHRNGYSKQESDHRDVEARYSDSARPRGNVRSQADRPLPAPVPRLRREDRVDVCARHDHPRNSRPFARDSMGSRFRPI